MGATNPSEYPKNSKGVLHPKTKHKPRKQGKERQFEGAKKCNTIKKRQETAEIKGLNGE